MSARVATLVLAALALAISCALPATALAANAIRTPANYDSNIIPRGDDTYSSVVALPLTMNWNGTVYNTIYINMNGNCTFGNFSTLYNPTTSMATTNRDMLAPFWADVDTRTGGGSSQMTYSNITSGNVPQVDGHNAFIVNWINVGRYNVSGPLNNFQLILIDRSDTGAGNFDIEYNYNTITWDRGTAASTAYARAGWGRAGPTGYEITGGNTNGAYLDTGARALVDGSLNSGGVLGRYVWSVRNGVPPNSPPIINLAFDTLNLEANGATGYTGYSGAGDATASDPDGSIASFVRTPAAGTFLPMGSTTVTWTATDNGGLVSVATQTIVVADTTPPTLPTVWSPTHSLSTWSTVAGIGIDWTESTDGGTGLQGYSYSWTQNAAGLPDTTTDGGYAAVGALNDTLENQTFDTAFPAWPPAAWTRSDATYVRTSAGGGRAQGTYSAEAWANDTTRRTVNFYEVYDLSSYTAATLTYTMQAVGFAGGTDYSRVEYSTDGTAWIRPIVDHTAAAGWAPHTVTLPVGGGASRVYVRFSGSVNRTAEYVDWDNITVTASVPAHNTLTQTPGEGRWYFNVRPVDNAGNWTGTAASLGPFWIDLTPPVTSSNIAAGWVNVAPTVTLTANDPLSGGAGTMYRIDGGGWTAYAGPFLYATDGTHVFDFYSTDTVGNMESPAMSSTLRLDRANPTTPTGLTATASAGSALLSWNAATDALSGMKEYRIYRNGVLVGTSTTTTFSDPVPSQGTYSYTVAAVDNAGNVGTQSAAAVIFVDTIPPTVPVLTSPTHPLTDHWYAGGAVTLNWTNATDVSSGIAGYSYSYTANVAGLPDTTTDPYTPGVPTNTNLDTQNFDAAAPAWPAYWTRSDTTYVRTSAGGARAQLTYSAEVWSDGNRRTASFQKMYDLSGYTSASVTYFTQLAGSNNNDYTRLEYSTTGGAPWTQLQNIGTAAAWNEYTFALPIGPTVYVRFTGSVSQTAEYVDWDRIRINVTDSGLNSATVDPGQGRWHFNLRAVDGAVNWTPGAADLGQIWIDAAPPVTTSNISAGWVNVAPMVTLTGTDLFSGVASTRYRIDGGGYTGYAAPFAYSTDGTHVVDFYSTDAVGNVESPRSATLRLDRIAPTVPSNVTLSPVDTRTVDVAWTGSTDIVSGVDYYSVYRDGSRVATTTATTYAAGGLTSGQTYSFRISATDRAGNESARSTDTTIAVPVATLWLELTATSVDFGDVDPGVPSTITNATSVSVLGIGPLAYDLSCSATDFVDADAGPPIPTMPIDSLSFRMYGFRALGIQPFAIASIPLDSSTGVPYEWHHDYTFDYTLTVPWTSLPAGYTATVTYTVVAN